MAIINDSDFIGLADTLIPVSLRASGSQPLLLGNDIRGTLHSIIGDGNRLTEISGRRLEEGMVVYLKHGYTITEGGETFTYTDNSYYTYRIVDGDAVRTLQNAGTLPNNNANWVNLETALSIDDIEIARLESELNTRIDSEETTRIREVARLDSELDTEEAARIADITRVDSEAAAETVRVNAEITRLDSELDTEETARIADITRVDSEAAAETVRVNAEIARVDSEATTETSRVNTEIARLDSELDTEETARIVDITRVDSEAAAETSRVNAEITRLDGVDTSLGTRISNEESARIAIDATLQSRIAADELALSTLDSELNDRIATIRDSEDANIRAIRTRRIPELPTDVARDLRYDPTTNTFSWEQPFQLTVNSVDGHLEEGDGIRFTLVNADPNDSESEIIISIDRDRIDRIIDSEIIITSTSVSERGGDTFTRYTDSEARAAVGVTRNVQDDILGNSPLIFETDDNLRRLVEYRESDGAGGNVIERIRTAEFINDVFTLTLVSFTPQFSTDGIGGNQLFWDIPGTGTTFTGSGVGIEVDVTGDTELTGIDDPFISSIRSAAGITGGSISDFDNFNMVSVGSPSSTATSYTLRAVVDSDSFIRPSTTSANGGIGGTVSGTVAFNQRSGTDSEVEYTGTIDDNTWSISWQNANTALANGGYRESRTNRNFLQTYTFSDVSYTNSRSGLRPGSTAVQSIAVSTTAPTSYVTLSSATGNGNIDFVSPVHKDTAQNVTVSAVTTLRRPATVTGSQYDINLTASTTLPAPIFQYPGIWLLTGVGVTPAREDIIDDTQSDGFESTVNVLADGFTGTGSNGEITIDNVPDTRFVWFGIRRSAPQPTNFEIFTGFAFASIADRVTGINPAVVVELEPDTPPAGWVDGEDYRLYGFLVEGGDTRVRIY